MDKKEFPKLALKSIKPEHLIKNQLELSDDDVAPFIMMLATFFNDLKSLMIIDGWRSEYRFPVNDETTSHAGEYAGIINFENRITVSVLHELFECILINKNILSVRSFVLIEQQLSPRAKELWSDIKNIATGNKKAADKKKFQQFLLMIRNNIGSHIQNKKVFVSGFRRHFYQSQGLGGDKAKYLYYTYTKNEMKDIRFYFADAVTEGYFREQLEKVGNVQDEWNNTVKFSVEIMFVLSEIISLYLNSKPHLTLDKQN